jgi:NAD-dependent DNA ligase adenylation domain
VVARQLKLLNEAVNYFRWHYYYDEPLISDYDFDRPLNQLKRLESEHLFLAPTVSAEVAPSRRTLPKYPL